MTKPETRYQKYLARKRQKQQGQIATPAHLRAAIAWQMRWVAHAPIHECLVPAILFEQGVGNLVFSRSLPDGRMALSVFRLDTICLGVKNAFFTITTKPRYTERLSGWSTLERLEPMHPACFRKLVEGGVAYARELGFNPHADYVVAHQIFGDVDAAACPTHFEYGHEGKPFDISGPHETATQVRTIVDQLQRRLGTGKLPLSPSGRFARRIGTVDSLTVDQAENSGWWICAGSPEGPSCRCRIGRKTIRGLRTIPTTAGPRIAP